MPSNSQNEQSAIEFFRAIAENIAYKPLTKELAIRNVRPEDFGTVSFHLGVLNGGRTHAHTPEASELGIVCTLNKGMVAGKKLANANPPIEFLCSATLLERKAANSK